MTLVRCTLLHTGDLHGRLSPAAAARIRTEKVPTPDALWLDAGDAIHAGNLGVPVRSDATLARMAEAGCDAMVAGNRETHLWRWALRRKIGAAPFPVLCANVSERGGSARHPLYQEYLVTALPNGLRVAVFGLTVPMVTSSMAARHVSRYLFHDPIERARALVPALAARADLVIALTHLGLEADRVLARTVPGIHLIVGGHSHDLLSSPVEVNGVPILHAGSHARHLGRAEVSLQGGRARVEWTLIPLPGRDGGAC